MHKLFNTADYSVPQLVLFGVAAAYWVWVYVVVIKDILKNRFVGIPVLAVCANIAWEFLWSFFFYTNMGAFFEWGYRAWFILDVFIFYSVLRFGKIQFANTSSKVPCITNCPSNNIAIRSPVCRAQVRSVQVSAEKTGAGALRGRRPPFCSRRKGRGMPRER